MPRKVRTNKRRVGAEVTDTQRAWLRGDWLLGTEHASRSVDDTMEALSLLSDGLCKNSALWSAHGNPETHFWRPKMNQPISMEDLEHNEACWLESGEAGADLYGGDSYFVHMFFNEAEKIALWRDFGDKENFHWEPLLRRPIPKGASVDAAMVAFTTIGPFNIE
jgi:hypothetical protein